MKQKTLFIESEIGKRIKASRISKKFTLEQLAKQTGFTKGYLSRIEKSEKSPPLATLGIIARVLGITISYPRGGRGTANLHLHCKKRGKASDPQERHRLRVCL